MGRYRDAKETNGLVTVTQGDEGRIERQDYDMKKRWEQCIKSSKPYTKLVKQIKTKLNKSPLITIPPRINRIHTRRKIHLILLMVTIHNTYVLQYVTVINLVTQSCSVQSIGLIKPFHSNIFVHGYLS